MQDTFLTLVGAVGATLIIARSFMFESIRNKLVAHSEGVTIFKTIKIPIVKLEMPIGYLIHCVQCLGFWVGLFFGFANVAGNTCFSFWAIPYVVLNAFLYGCAVSVVAMTVDSWLARRQN